MFKKIIFIAYIFTFSILAGKVYGQSCGETLNEAREKFSAGHFYEIPALLKPCLDNGFNKDQRIEAYWILTRTYLFIDDPISAEDSYLKLLKQDPEYNIDADRDPIDVVYLSKKFKTTPIFVVYTKVGSNYTAAQVINNYGVDNTTVSSEEYSGKFGFQLGGGGEVNLSDNLSFGGELNLFQRSYSYKNTLFGSDTQNYTENMLGIELPVYFKYRQDYEKIRPYIYAGMGINYLLSANATLKLTDRVGVDDLTEIPVTGPEVNIKDLRSSFNHFLHVGFGINYRIGYNYLVADLRYSKGLSNIVDPEGQYSNSTLLYKYAYVDDDKRLSNIAISVGFVKPLYKARKVTSFSSKGFLSRIFGKGGDK